MKGLKFWAPIKAFRYWRAMNRYRSVGELYLWVRHHNKMGGMLRTSRHEEERLLGECKRLRLRAEAIREGKL